LQLIAQANLSSGYCAGWEIQGNNQQWYPATVRGTGVAQITLDASLPSGVTPVQGRYAWANWPLATVYDSEQNPMVPTYFATVPAAE